MTPESKLKVAHDCQKLGRFVSQLQNLDGVSLPRPAIGRFGRFVCWVLAVELPPPGVKYELTSKFVTELTNALMSAGNIMETEAKHEIGKARIPQQPSDALKPCTRSCDHE